MSPGKFSVGTVIPKPLEPLEYLVLVKVCGAEAELHVVRPEVVTGGEIPGLDLDTKKPITDNSTIGLHSPLGWQGREISR